MRRPIAVVMFSVGIWAALFGLGWGQGPSRDISIEEQRSERRVALVVGNAGYPRGRLRNPVNDARGMVAALKALNFDVLAFEDLD